MHNDEVHACPDEQAEFSRHQDGHDEVGNNKNELIQEECSQTHALIAQPSYQECLLHSPVRLPIMPGKVEAEYKIDLCCQQSSHYIGQDRIPSALCKGL